MQSSLIKFIILINRLIKNIIKQKQYIRTKTNRGKTFTVPEIRVTGPNGIMVAQTFCDIFFIKKRHQISIYKQFSD
jgi:hypothetical protein